MTLLTQAIAAQEKIQAYKNAKPQFPEMVEALVEIIRAYDRVVAEYDRFELADIYVEHDGMSVTLNCYMQMYGDEPVEETVFLPNDIVTAEDPVKAAKLNALLGRKKYLEEGIQNFEFALKDRKEELEQVNDSLAKLS